MSAWIVKPLLGSGNMSIGGLDFMKTMTKPPVEMIKGALSGLGTTAAGVILAILGIVLIFFVITWIGKLLRKLLVGRAKRFSMVQLVAARFPELLPARL